MAPAKNERKFEVFDLIFAGFVEEGEKIIWNPHLFDIIDKNVHSFDLAE